MLQTKHLQINAGSGTEGQLPAASGTSAAIAEEEVWCYLFNAQSDSEIRMLDRI